jgi:hypothetical protein
VKNTRFRKQDLLPTSRETVWRNISVTDRDQLLLTDPARARQELISVTGYVFFTSPRDAAIRVGK